LPRHGCGADSKVMQLPEKSHATVKTFRRWLARQRRSIRKVSCTDAQTAYTTFKRFPEGNHASSVRMAWELFG